MNNFLKPSGIEPSPRAGRYALTRGDRSFSNSFYAYPGCKTDRTSQVPRSPRRACRCHPQDYTGDRPRLPLPAATLIRCAHLMLPPRASFRPYGTKVHATGRGSRRL